MKYSKEAQSIHDRLVEVYGIRDPGGEVLVDLICRSFDLYQQAEKEIQQYGVTVEDRYGGRKSNPATSVARDCKTTIISSLKALNLDFQNVIDYGTDSN